MAPEDSGKALEHLVSAMREPSFYPHNPEAVSVAQTHISYVFLAGGEVYKIKKPVAFTFLDFSTLERRRHICHEEVRLNRRLAPDVYRGVVSICADGKTYRLGAETDARAVEYAVHMRRLPDDRILARLLDQGGGDVAMIDAVSNRLVEFHRAADASDAVRANGDPQAIAAVLGDNYRGVAPFRDRTIPAADDDAIQEFAHSFLARHAAVFRRRQEEHRIREGHGDLHAEHICFTDPLVIFDCVEFSPRFRYCDVASDIAFLAMDLEYRRRPDLSARLVASYAANTDDRRLPWLAPFYQCYRAYVRGKVDSLTSAETEVDAETRAAAEAGARRHFALAYRYTWSYSPSLVVVAGLSGTGKSTVAARLAERTGFTHINSDVVRKELLGLPLTVRPEAELRQRLYSAEHSERTYAAMLKAGEQELAQGRGAIIDATFQLFRGRAAARALAQRAEVPMVLVECRCDEADVRERLARRQGANTSPSDADWAVYRQQRQRFEAFRADEPRIVVDTAKTETAELTRAIENAVRYQQPRT